MTKLSTDLSAKMAAVLKAVEGFDKKLGEQRAEIKADFRSGKALTIAMAALILGTIGAVLTVGNDMLTRGLAVGAVVKSVAEAKTSGCGK